MDVEFREEGQQLGFGREVLGVVLFTGRGFDGSGNGSGGECRSGIGSGGGVLMCLWCGVSVYGSGVFFQYLYM